MSKSAMLLQNYVPILMANIGRPVIAIAPILRRFVKALTDAGYLSALIPEEYGGLSLPISAGAAILEEIHRSGGNAAACHAQMYTMGTVLRHGSDSTKTAISAFDC
jgi:alkylation response protein AidB-like acyl-CoA dehydrogenase